MNYLLLAFLISATANMYLLIELWSTRELLEIWKKGTRNIVKSIQEGFEKNGVKISPSEQETVNFLLEEK